MQIVIDMPKEVLNSIKTFKGKFICENGYDLIQGIKNGTSLPKGHGGLVDMSEVLIKLMQFYDGNKSIGQCLDEVNTIIEAEGGDAE